MLINRLVSVIWILYLSLDYAQSTIVKDVHPWDLLIYTQNWPVTVCKEWKEKDQSHTCAMPAKKDSWSIHGIWPTKLGTIGPAFCNRSWHFDPEEIRPIETTLTQFWTNVEKETSTYALWAHEWTKHGTCAAILEPLSSELKYFSKGLEWFQKFGMSNILSDAGIVPSNQVEYTIESINDAVKSRLGINPAIECKKENESISMVAEILPAKKKKTIAKFWKNKKKINHYLKAIYVRKEELAQINKKILIK